MSFDTTIKKETVFGLVKIEYFPPSIIGDDYDFDDYTIAEDNQIPEYNNDTQIKESNNYSKSFYRATIITGEWQGWNAKSPLGRNTAVKRLLNEITGHYVTQLELD